MNILVFDTVLNKTFIGLSIEGNEIYKTIESDDENYHSAYLIKTLSDILSENKLELKQIDYIGTNTGVGSFTGIRVGLSVAKVIAGRLSIKIAPMTTVEVLSSYFKNNNILIDARRNSFFYSKDGIETSLIDFKNAIEIIENTNSSFICDNNIIKNEKFSKYKDKLISYENCKLDLSGTEIQIAKNKIKENKTVDANCLKATYIQTPPIFGI